MNRRVPGVTEDSGGNSREMQNMKEQESRLFIIKTLDNRGAYKEEMSWEFYRKEEYITDKSENAIELHVEIPMSWNNGSATFTELVYSQQISVAKLTSAKTADAPFKKGTTDVEEGRQLTLVSTDIPPPSQFI